MRASVIIPCHNAGRYIAQALRSAAAQTLPPHEIIVIDDDSTDDSRKQIEASGVPVRVLETKAHNAGAARNVGIAAAAGDWIAFLDADDLWYPQHLEFADELLRRSDDVAFIAYHHYLERESEVRDIPDDLRPKLAAPATGLPARRFPELCTQGFHFGHSTVLLRRDRVDAVGGFDLTQKRRHDFDLWLRIIREHTWSYDTRPHAQYRLDTPGSISKSIVEAEYFFLRALKRNRQGFAGPAMDQLIRTSARRAMSLAFVDGRREDYLRARPLAWSDLSRNFRRFYRWSRCCPPLFRTALRLKRHWVMRGRHDVDAAAKPNDGG